MLFFKHHQLSSSSTTKVNEENEELEREREGGEEEKTKSDINTRLCRGVLPHCYPKALRPDDHRRGVCIERSGEAVKRCCGIAVRRCRAGRWTLNLYQGERVHVNRSLFWPSCLHFFFLCVPNRCGLLWTTKSWSSVRSRGNRLEKVESVAGSGRVRF
mgnify:CR=1 FL=1